MTPPPSTLVQPPNRGTIIISLAPTVAFLIGNNLSGLVAGMVAATVVSAVLIVYRRRRSLPIGWLLPIALGFVVIRGVAGVLTGSEDVFFGFGIATGAFLAIGVGVTAFTRRPLAMYVIPLFGNYDRIAGDPIYGRVAAQITFGWALAELIVTGFEAWHLSVASANEFVIVRAIIAWPFMFLVIFGLVFYMNYQFIKREHELAIEARRTDE